MFYLYKQQCMKLCVYKYVVADCANDIVFVVDSSASIHPDDFTLMKNFLYQLVGRLHIDSDSTRVGLVVYSTKVDSEKSFYLNSYSSVKAVQSAISSIRHLEGNTNTSGAFAYVRTTILTSAGGARSNMPNIVVVFTDGRPNYPLSTLVSIEIHMFVCIDMMLLGDIVEIDYAYCYRCYRCVVCLFVCLSRSCIVLKQQKISTISFAPMSIPDRIKIWLTSLSPFLPKFCPNVTIPVI